MAIVKIHAEKRVLTDPAEVARYLAGASIEYERWQASRPVADDASGDEILAIYADDIATLKERGGYLTADIIDVKPETPGLEAMLQKFSREHWHDEDEVRFIVKGSGIFHIHPKQGPVFAIEVVPGDLIRVPRGTWHWFDLCAERRIRAIRLFQDPAGWTPRYTESGVERQYEPVCFGPELVGHA